MSDATSLACFGCGQFGDYVYFGLPTTCPKCGSGEVRSKELWDRTPDNPDYDKVTT